MSELFPWICRGGVNPGHEPLGSRLLVAGSTVELSGEEKAADLFGFQGWLKLGGRAEVIFDRISKSYSTAYPARMISAFSKPGTERMKAS